nr:putative dsRNA-binding protein [Nostoc sp. CHAB 5715]
MLSYSEQFHHFTFNFPYHVGISTVSVITSFVNTTIYRNKLGVGKGRSIKTAEQAAAKVAFLAIPNPQIP